jgi:RimJ/RimL family protein N-acetyltransferase
MDNYHYISATAEDGARVVIGSYSLDPLPGCPVIGVSHHLNIYPEWRGKGHGTQAMQERLDKAKELGFRILLCTVRTYPENTPQVKILRRFGWKICREFSNVKTHHNVTLYIKDLHDPYEYAGGS